MEEVKLKLTITRRNTWETDFEYKIIGEKGKISEEFSDELWHGFSINYDKLKTIDVAEKIIDFLKTDPAFERYWNGLPEASREGNKKQINQLYWLE